MWVNSNFFYIKLFENTIFQSNTFNLSNDDIFFNEYRIDFKTLLDILWRNTKQGK